LEEEVDEVDYVKDPLIEILAIKLYEHATRGNPDVKPTYWPPSEGNGGEAWCCLDKETRDLFRNMAKGLDPIE